MIRTGEILEKAAVSLFIGAIVFSSMVVQAKPPVSCPFNIPVATLPPHTLAGFSWGPVIRPMDDPCLSHIAVEPLNDSIWYVGGEYGLYLTKDAGRTWSHPLKRQVGALVVFRGLLPISPSIIYVGIENILYVSRDKGSHWSVVKKFNGYVKSVLVAGKKLYVGLAVRPNESSGVFVLTLNGSQSQFHPFGKAYLGLIVWTIARDPRDGTLYAGTEIPNHPQPYHPPFFRSLDNGVTWENVAGTLPWHVIAAAVRPNDGYVYALTEGPGLYGSLDKGASWQAPVNNPALGDSLLMNSRDYKQLFSGRQKIGYTNGGIFLSNDAGKVFKPVGLSGVTVAGIALNGKGTRIYATAYGSGIYTSKIPVIKVPK